MTVKFRATYINGAFGNQQEGWEWNAYDRLEDGHLTNNNAEGANNRLASRARTAHPGLYRFCDLVKSELQNVRNKCTQFEAGNLHPTQCTRARRTEKTRTQLKTLLENRHITLRKYAIGQGQLNVVVKGKKTKTGRQEEMGVTHFWGAQLDNYHCHRRSSQGASRSEVCRQPLPTCWEVSHQNSTYILSRWYSWCCFCHHLGPVGDFLTRFDKLSGLSFSLFSELVDLYSFLGGPFVLTTPSSSTTLLNCSKPL